MRTIRRLYFYAVAFVSFELVLWGTIGLLRSILARSLGRSSGAFTSNAVTTDALAQALALVLVGVPIFLAHWIWVQRAAARDPEEHSATLRAVFLYGTLLSTLLPVAQNTLALLNRSILEAAHENASRAMLGGSQLLSDNLIAIALNTIAALYFYRILQRDWGTLADRENFANVRRLYRFIWVVYALALTVAGVQQIIRYIFFFPSGGLGIFGRAMFLNALSLLLVGAPLWAYTWQLSLSALDEPGERESNLRLGFLYLLSLVSAVTVLGAAGVLLDTLLIQALGEGLPTNEFIQKVGGALAVAIPFGALWAYYGRAFRLAIADQPDPGRRAGLRRLYNYPLALLGLGAAFIGTTTLLTYVIDTSLSSLQIAGTFTSRLAAGLSTLLVGLPLWLASWRPMQAEAHAAGDEGAHARRSLVRRVYLYLVIFAAVIGGMSSAVWVVFQLISALLGGAPSDFVTQLLTALQLLLLFMAVLAYHLVVLRSDGARTADTLTERHAAFPVLVFAPDETFSAAVSEAILKQTPDMPIIVHPLDQPISAEHTDGARAAVLPAALALQPPEALRLWLNSFEGEKVIIPQEVSGWVWSGQFSRPLASHADQAALALRQLAEGESLQPSVPASPWMIVLYVLAAYVGLQVLLLLFALIGAVVGGF
jgi:hypothetical protein